MLIRTLREWIDGKRVLLLGFGREGRAVYRRIMQAGGYAALGIADRNALADAPEITVGKEFKRWSPISGLSIKHSNGETDFVVYMNIDIEKYETAPQSEADVYFRINGKIHGKKIIRYLAYDPELRALWDILEEARN